MKNWKKKEFLAISLLLIVPFFFFGFKQDYTRATELCLAGLKPNMTYHWLAMLSIVVSCIFWWMFTIANLINQKALKGGLR